MKQVLVRRKNIHGSINRMVTCEVLAEKNGVLRCKCEDKRQPEEIQASEAVPAQLQRHGSVKAAPVAQSLAPSRHALSNRYR